MKTFILGSLFLSILLAGSNLYAQFDGENGQNQMPFSYEPEDESRPNFLTNEEEVMIFEAWKAQLALKGLENVEVLETIDLREMLEDVQITMVELKVRNQKLESYIARLEDRNEQLQLLSTELIQDVILLKEENDLYTIADKDDSENEAFLEMENETEILAMSEEVDVYESEISENEAQIIFNLESLTENLEMLAEVEDVGETLSLALSAKMNEEAMRNVQNVALVNP